MNDYKTDRQWSDQHIEGIKRIVGPLLIVPSTIEVDTKQAADLVMLKARNMMIAARVRRPGWEVHGRDEFTIRASKRSGAKTEMRKIMSGWADWMFYGHALADIGPGIGRWMVIDLDALRYHWMRFPASLREAEMHTNKNGDSTFAVFNAVEINCMTPVIVDQSKPMDERLVGHG